MAEHVAELHVLPHERSGGWVVAHSGGAAALSWHGTAGEAELAAQRQAAGQSATHIVLHDRYQRVRAITARAPSRPAARWGEHGV